MMNNEFEIQKILSETKEKIAYQVNSKTQSHQFIIKYYNQKYLTANQINDSFKCFEILQEIQHPLLVAYYKYINDQKSQQILVLTESIKNNNSLEGFILRIQESNKLLDEQTVWYLLDQILELLQILHSKGIYHLNLKPSNILITHEGNIKITDIDLFNQNQNEDCKLKEYRDIWDVGMIILNLIICHSYHTTKSSQKLLVQRIQKETYLKDVPQIYSKDLKDILKLILKKSDTPSTEFLMNHPVLQQVKQMRRPSLKILPSLSLYATNKDFSNFLTSDQKKQSNQIYHKIQMNPKNSILKHIHLNVVVKPVEEPKTVSRKQSILPKISKKKTKQEPLYCSRNNLFLDNDKNYQEPLRKYQSQFNLKDVSFNQQQLRIKTQFYVKSQMQKVISLSQIKKVLC